MSTKDFLRKEFRHRGETGMRPTNKQGRWAHSFLLHVMQNKPANQMFPRAWLCQAAMEERKEGPQPGPGPYTYPATIAGAAQVSLFLGDLPPRKEQSDASGLLGCPPGNWT